MLQARLLAIALIPLGLGLATPAAGQEADAGPASRPIVDPELVGTWSGITNHYMQSVTIEIRAGGTIKETQGTMGGPPLGSTSVVLLRATDGKWWRDSGASGTYKIKNRNRLEWKDDRGGYPIRMDREAGAASRPATTPRLIAPQDLDTIAELIALSNDPEPEYRELALAHLGGLGNSIQNADAALPVLVAALSDPVPGVASIAAHRIGRLGPWGRPAAKPLIDSLRSADPELRRQAAHALGEIGTEADLAIPALAAVVMDPDESTAVVAVHVLGRFGTKSAATLGDALRNPSSSVIYLALKELEKLKSDGAPAVPALVRFLREGDADYRGQAIDVIVAMGAAGRPAVPELIRTLDGDPDLAIKAAKALSAFPEDGEKSVPGIVRLLGRTKDSFWMRSRRRTEIINTLGAFGPAAASAVPALTKLIDDQWESEPVRRAAASARKKIAGE